MARISRSSVHNALERAGTNLNDAGGPDGRISRADVKAKLTELTGTEKKLTDIFFRFVDHRDHVPGATVTRTDVKRAVAYAKEKMVDAYDLNKNGLSKAEIAKMSLTGKLAVDLARELKAAAVADVGGGTHAAVAQELEALAKDIRFDWYGSESDDAFTAFSVALGGKDLTVENFRAATGTAADVEITERDLEEFFTAMQDPDNVAEDGDRAKFAALEQAMKAKLTGAKVFMVGGDDVVEGKVYFLGKTPQGDAAGLSATRIWT